MKRISALGPVFLMIISAALVACGFKMLLIPQQLLSSGVSGVAMVVGYLSGWNIGWLYFALNVPILLLGYRALGLRFIGLSMVTVVATTIFLQFIPLMDITNDRLLAAVFGGVLVGLGTAVTFRYGGSSGGFDILAAIITRYRDVPIGILTVVLNSFVIATLGVMQKDWNAALYSMLSIYLTGRVIDMMHTPHLKVTALIVTIRSKELRERLMQIPRGVTIFKTTGAYTSEERDLLMTVTTRYELAELKRLIKEIDPKAFVNIVPTIDVIGSFRRHTT